MPEQIEAVTGRKLRRPYESMITAQAAHLPEIYRAREQKKYQEQTAGQRARELTMAEKGQKVQQEQTKRATALSAVGTGAMIGGQVGGGYGALIGGAAGLVAWGVSEYF